MSDGQLPLERRALLWSGNLGFGMIVSTSLRIRMVFWGVEQRPRIWVQG